MTATRLRLVGRTVQDEKYVVVSLPYGYQMAVTWDYCLAIVWLPLGYPRRLTDGCHLEKPYSCQLITMQLSYGCHLVIMWLSYGPCGYHLVATWLTCGYHMVATWLPCGYHMVATFLVAMWTSNVFHLITRWHHSLFAYFCGCRVVDMCLTCDLYCINSPHAWKDVWFGRSFQPPEYMEKYKNSIHIQYT
jgi:hypothetical protein